ncbi:hypothetical protein NFI96_005800 [Prochilodus magdalenae]|nr:hypothetical protein NFI96_005800 [Prochilodus magdalenae]
MYEGGVSNKVDRRGSTSGQVHKEGVSNKVASEWKYKEGVSNKVASEWKYKESVSIKVATEWKYKEGVSIKVATEWKYKEGVSNKVASEWKYNEGVSIKVASEWKYKEGVSIKLASEWKYKEGVSNKVASEWKYKEGVSIKVASEWKYKEGVSNKVASEWKYKEGVSNKVASEWKYKEGVSNKVASEWKYKESVSIKVASEWKYTEGVSNKVASEWKYKEGVSIKLASEWKYKEGVSNKVASEWKYKEGVSIKVASEWKYKEGVSIKVASEWKYKEGVSIKVASEWKYKEGVSIKVASEWKHKEGVSNKVASDGKYKDGVSVKEAILKSQSFRFLRFQSELSIESRSGLEGPRAVGNKPNSSPKGQTPDESRRTDANSSVSDLANSVTSDMLMLSPGSEEEEHEGPVCEKLGRIQFSVGYSFQDSTLTVKILKGQDLPAKDFSGTSDPFVKIYLLPDKKHKLETKVKRKNLNPHWNETFLFEGFPYEKVVQRTLYLQVLDYDRFSRNDPIGEVSIPLNKIDLANMQTFWKELKPCSDGSGSRGDLLVSLCYNPTANIITVNIIKARNLKAMDIGGTSDPYVKVWLMHKDKRVEKKKTVVMKRCLNPVFNESFPFDVPAHVLRETTIVITVMDKDRLSRNDVIGKPHTGPAEGAVGVGGGGTPGPGLDVQMRNQVLTTVPPHTDSLGVSTKTKAGLVNEDDPLPF